MIDGRVVDKPVDRASWGPLRALYEWLKPATPSPYLPSSPASAPDRGDVPARIGHDAIERQLAKAAWASCPQRAMSASSAPSP